MRTLKYHAKELAFLERTALECGIPFDELEFIHVECCMRYSARTKRLALASKELGLPIGIVCRDWEQYKSMVRKKKATTSLIVKINQK
jgi:hypothetical protein